MYSEHTDTAPPRVDGYRILRVIGHGGMSTVYLAEQASLSRKVALKVMLPEALADEVSRGRFENEARTIARLQHPHIVGIHEVGRTVDGLPFYSMPHLPRGHLAQRDLRGDQPRVAAILRPLLQALDYAHVRGVVHRDVKAENVLFDDNERPQLADFGIALRRGSNPRLTSTGLAVGSTAYMPPEQARGGNVDRRADLYSLGVLAWEMLTGRLPYNAGDALSMAMMHTQDPIPRLPPALRHWQGFIDKAMAKHPDQRFASAQDMLDALDALERRSGRAFGVVVVPPLATGTLKTEAGGSRWKPVALGLLVLGVLGFGLARVMQPPQPAVANPAPVTAKVPEPANPLPAPQAGAQTGMLPGIDTAVDDGAGSAYLANAEQQLQAGRLLAPANANAWDSWDAAWRVNPTLPRVQMLTARLFDALADASERGVRSGDTTAARLAFQRAQQLDARRGGDGSAVALLRTRLKAALEARLEALVAEPDRTATEVLLAQTGWVGLDAALIKAVRVKLAASEPAGPAVQRIAAQPGAAAAKIDIQTVSRAEYARFASATSRPSAPCGRNGMFGGKRDWSSPGDRLGSSAPVLCVSAADAQAYASWRSAQEKRRYRLPSAGELSTRGAMPLSGWLTLCADAACRRRKASGLPQPLDAARGYPNVGIRLVRER